MEEWMKNQSDHGSSQEDFPALPPPAPCLNRAPLCVLVAPWTFLAHKCLKWGWPVELVLLALPVPHCSLEFCLEIAFRTFPFFFVKFLRLNLVEKLTVYSIDRLNSVYAIIL